MICKNCKYFKKGHFKHSSEGPIIFEEESSTGMCLHLKICSDYVDDWLGRETETPINDGVYANCDENRGHLIVGEHFGCIHFEKKI